VWLPDGLNYPGQADLRDRQERLADSLRQVYARLGGDQRLVLEYKLFEPAFYATDVPDWGTAYVHCIALGERAVVCLATGHHAPSTKIEFIVTQLLRLGRLGAFDFNSRSPPRSRCPSSPPRVPASGATVWMAQRARCRCVRL